MSRSWLERQFALTVVHLGREQVSIRRANADGIEAAVVDDGENRQPWHGAVDTLKALLDGGPVLTRRVRLVVANEFVRYVLVPWNDQVLKPEEREQLARALMAERYGSREQGWRVTVEPVRYRQASLAAALDEELIGAVDTLLKAKGSRLVSVLPALVASINGVAGRIPAKARGWLVAAQDARIASLAFCAGSWLQVASERVQGNAAQTLESMLKRDMARAPALEGGSVFQIGPAGKVPVLDSAWPQVNLQGDAS